jgi:hypothetical protein
MTCLNLSEQLLGLLQEQMKRWPVVQPEKLQGWKVACSSHDREDHNKITDFYSASWQRAALMIEKTLCAPLMIKRTLRASLIIDRTL